jgi:hypothetical protein
MTSRFLVLTLIFRLRCRSTAEIRVITPYVTRRRRSTRNGCECGSPGPRVAGRCAAGQVAQVCRVTCPPHLPCEGRHPHRQADQIRQEEDARPRPRRRDHFNPAAGRRLLRALQEHQAIATEGGDGNYIVISVEEGAVQVGELDPRVVASAIAGLLKEDEIVSHLADLDLPVEMVMAFRAQSA